MREGITRRQMLLGNLAGLLGGLLATLLGPWLGRGRAAPNRPAPSASTAHPGYRYSTNDPLNQVTTYTYDAGARLDRAAAPGLVSVTTYTYTCEGTGRLDGW